MRAMWLEFPEQTETYDMNTQFMFGHAILFAPKVNNPTTILSSLQKQEINFFLPNNNIWYNYQTKVEESLTGQW